MPRYSASKVVFDWISYRVLIQGLRLLGVPVMVVHYEDFVRSPRTVVADVLRFCGVEPHASALVHLHDDAVVLGTHHTVAGNPMRFRTGRIPLQVDEAWRTEMSTRTRWWVSALTAPIRWWDSARHPRATSPDTDPGLLAAPRSRKTRSSARPTVSHELTHAGRHDEDH